MHGAPMSNPTHVDDDPIFDGLETFPAINIAETVDSLIADRGIQDAAAHASEIARIARAMKELEVAQE